MNPVPFTQKLTAVCMRPCRQKTTGVGTRQSYPLGTCTLYWRMSPCCPGTPPMVR